MFDFFVCNNSFPKTAIEKAVFTETFDFFVSTKEIIIIIEN